MFGIYSTDQMRELDQQLMAKRSLHEIIDRAGYGIANLAGRILKVPYGKTVVVLSGTGNNAKDGLAAARVLTRMGAKVLIEPVTRFKSLKIPSADLVIDAVLGFGFRGEFSGIGSLGGQKILSIDVPSGIDADSGIASPNTSPANFTVSLVGLKPGLFLGDGPRLCGETYLYSAVEFPKDLEPAGWFVAPQDVSLVRRDFESHKWSAGVAVFAGSTGMAGAAALACGAAMRSGAGIVHLMSAEPSASFGPLYEDPEIVLSNSRWDSKDNRFDPELDLSRFKSVVIGPGLGEYSREILRHLLGRFDGPMVIDADALSGVAQDPKLLEAIRNRVGETVLTPHAGELSKLMRAANSGTSHSAFVEFARSHMLYLLVKGFPTRIYGPDGKYHVVASNGSNLASAGTGDVLSGIIGARLAASDRSGASIVDAAMIHGLASQLSPNDSLTANDLVKQIPGAISLLSRWPQAWNSAPFVPIQATGPLCFSSQSQIDWGVS